MALDLAPAAIVRAGSGFLFVLLSFLIFSTSHRRLRNVALGSLFLGLGGFVLMSNVVDSESMWAIAFLPLVAIGLVATLLVPGTQSRREAPLIIAGLVAGVAVSISMFASPMSSPRGPSNLIGLAMATTATLVWSARAMATVDARVLRHEAALALAFGLYAANQAGAMLSGAALRSGDLPETMVPAFLVGLGAATWLVVGSRRRYRIAIATGLALIAAVLVGELRAAFIPTTGTDTTGIIGVMRILGWSVLVWAILRHDLLDIGLKPVTVRRGTLAAAALATLFIVAQVAQNFLSASYGLLTGGIVAGALLFAAAPLQRAAERVIGSAPERSRSTERDTKAYRHALRAALADGAMTAEEEEHLAELAETLSLGAATALRLRRDEEARITHPNEKTGR